MKSTLSLLFIIVLLNSCCNCDCPEEGTAVIPNISDTTESLENSASSDIVDSIKAETVLPEDQAMNEPVEEKKEVESSKKEESKGINEKPDESNAVPIENTTDGNSSMNSGDSERSRRSSSE